MTLTIEQMKAIVEGAPDGADFQYQGKRSAGFFKEMLGGLYKWDSIGKAWKLTHFDNLKQAINFQSEPPVAVYELKDLRAAIAEHEQQEKATVAEAPSYIAAARKLYEQIEGYKNIAAPSATDEIHNNALDIALREIMNHFPELKDQGHD